jgi:hypothetical protein
MKVLVIALLVGLLCSGCGSGQQPATDAMTADSVSGHAVFAGSFYNQPSMLQLVFLAVKSCVQSNSTLPVREDVPDITVMDSMIQCGLVNNAYGCTDLRTGMIYLSLSGTQYRNHVPAEEYIHWLTGQGDVLHGGELLKACEYAGEQQPLWTVQF